VGVAVADGVGLAFGFEAAARPGAAFFPAQEISNPASRAAVQSVKNLAMAVWEGMSGRIMRAVGGAGKRGVIFYATAGVRRGFFSCKHHFPMKRLSLLAAVTAVFLPLSFASAQQQGGGQRMRMSIDQRLEMMKSKLSLTDDQVAKLKTIFEAQKAQLDPIFQDKSLTPEQKREKAKPIMEAGRAKVDEVLTPEQKAKRDEFRKESMRKAGQD
jgi:Spy/CpxP family protein refolding chaperone